MNKHSILTKRNIGMK